MAPGRHSRKGCRSDDRPLGPIPPGQPAGADPPQAGQLAGLVGELRLEILVLLPERLVLLCWGNIRFVKPVGDDCQSASAIPAGVVVIAGGLCLRCIRHSMRRHGYSVINVPRDLSRHPIPFAYSSFGFGRIL